MTKKPKARAFIGALLALVAVLFIACEPKQPDLGKRGSDSIQWCTIIPKQENRMEPFTIPVKGRISFRIGNHWVESADGNWFDLVDMDRICTTEVNEYQREHTVLMCQDQPGCPYSAAPSTVER